MSAAPTGRFAPTPSGRLHLGNIACALLAYLSVRSEGGRFLLRIEDLDVPRCPRALSMQIIDDLRFLGFDWDEPPLFQSERTAVYEAALARLEAMDAVYPCFCTRAQLHATQAPNLGDQEPVYPGTCARLTPEEIAAQMNMPVDKVREILKIAQEPVSLETPIGEEEDSHLGDFIPDEGASEPSEAASFTLLKEQLVDVLSTLTPREEKVLKLRFGIEDGRTRTLEEVGKEFNVTRERIRQIEAKALRKLRHPSRSKKLKDFLN